MKSRSQTEIVTGSCPQAESAGRRGSRRGTEFLQEPLEFKRRRGPAEQLLLQATLEEKNMRQNSQFTKRVFAVKARSAACR